MKELEMKFLEIDRAELLAKLSDVHAVKTLDAILKTIYFDFPDGRIFKNKELCRVRTFGEKIEFCTKVNMRIEDGCKVYDEIEVEVSSIDNMCKILENLGMQQVIHFEKRRIEYMYENVKFEIDEFPGVPVFLELEASSADIIKTIVEKFELGKYESSYLTGEELLKQKYNKELNGLKF